MAAAVVRRMLAARPSIRLVVAETARQGLRLAVAERPSLILLDGHLPDLDADEVRARLCAAPATRDIPVVMVTADSPPDGPERDPRGGPAGWLTKPFAAEALLDIVDGVATSTGPQPGSGGGDPILDDALLDGLREVAGTEPGRDFASLLSLYVTHARDELEELRAAVAAGDPRALERSAHSLAGSSATFGAPRVGRASRRLEELARDGDLARAPAALQQLEADFAATAAALERARR